MTFHEWLKKNPTVFPCGYSVMESAWNAADRAARKDCARIAAPENIAYSDEEWRIRLDVRDAIRESIK